MSLEQKAGQMIYAGVLEDDTCWPNRETEEIIRRGLVGAVRIYGARHEPYFCASFMNQLQQWARQTSLGMPLLVGADLETGASAICARGATTFPQQMALGVGRSPKTVEEISGAIARESVAVGVHMNHRPVADANTNPANPIVGVRSFGSETDAVSTLVESAVRGAAGENLLAIVKHFPGHGEADSDSHLDLPVVACDEKTFRSRHLKPFVRAIRAGADGVMTAHIIVSALDPEYPATLSPKIMTGILRDEMGFDGLVITDSMNMRGITSRYDLRSATVKAVQAGVDLVLSIGSLDAQLERREAIVQAVKDGVIDRGRIDDSVRRILRAKEKAGILQEPLVDPVRALKVCGSAEHVRLARKGFASGITIVKNSDGALPLKRESTVLVTGFRAVEKLGRALARVHPRLIIHALPSTDIAAWRNISWEDVDAPMRTLTRYKESTEGWRPNEDELALVVRLARQSDVVVTTVYGYKKSLFAGQALLLEEISRSVACPLVVVSLGFPGLKQELPDCAAYVATHLRDDLPWPLAEPLADMLVGNGAAGG